MNWPQHLFIGFIIGIVLCFIFSFDFFSSIQVVLVCSFSALLPDIDHKDSKIRRLISYAALLFSFLFPLVINYHDIKSIFNLALLEKILFQSLAIFGAYSVAMLFLMPPHRGFVHSILFCVLYGILLFTIFGFWFSVFGVAGFVSHLLADKEIKLT